MQPSIYLYLCVWVFISRRPTSQRRDEPRIVHRTQSVFGHSVQQSHTQNNRPATRAVGYNQIYFIYRERELKKYYTKSLNKKKEVSTNIFIQNQLNFDQFLYWPKKKTGNRDITVYCAISHNAAWNYNTWTSLNSKPSPSQY